MGRPKCFLNSCFRFTVSIPVTTGLTEEKAAGGFGIHQNENENKKHLWVAFANHKMEERTRSFHLLGEWVGGERRPLRQSQAGGWGGGMLLSPDCCCRLKHSLVNVSPLIGTQWVEGGHNKLAVKPLPGQGSLGCFGITSVCILNKDLK